MRSKPFVLLFFLFPFIFIGTIFLLDYIIDPFGITNYNILNIQYKMARDDRTEKIERIRKIEKIDNIILGSSRSQHIDPTILNSYFGGYSYNFGVGGGNSADALGVLLYLNSQHKFPSHVLLTLDFSTFLGDGNSPTFYKLPELNFYNKNMHQESQIAKFLSIDAVRASFKTIKAHILSTTPTSYFNKEGFMVVTKKKELSAPEISKLSSDYVNRIYSGGNITISKERLHNVEQIVALCKQNKADLTITLTPVSYFQYDLIKNNIHLSSKIEAFKEQLSAIHPFYDAMIDNIYIRDLSNFEDNVHTNEKYGKLYMQAIYKHENKGLVSLRE